MSQTKKSKVTLTSRKIISYTSNFVCFHFHWPQLELKNRPQRTNQHWPQNSFNSPLPPPPPSNATKNAPSASSLSLSLLFFSLLSISSPASISVSPQILSKSGDPITIQWSQIPSPSNLDWLGIYSPPDSSHDHFIGYLFLSSSPTRQSGSGSITIPLKNLRSDYQFRIFRWTQSEVNPKHQDHDHNPLPDTKHLLSASRSVGFEQGRGPEQVHLAYTGRGDDEMRVMFVTRDGAESFARYGLREDGLELSVGTVVGRYEREDMCDAPANESIGWRDPGFIPDGVMTGLKKGKRYYYQVIIFLD